MCKLHLRHPGKKLVRYYVVLVKSVALIPLGASVSGLHCSIWNFLHVIQKILLGNPANMVNCVALTFSEQGLNRE